MLDFDMDALRESARIAYRQFENLSEREQESVLKAIQDVGTDAESEVAARSIYLRAEQRRLQLTLHALLDGVGERRVQR